MQATHAEEHVPGITTRDGTATRGAALYLILFRPILLFLVGFLILCALFTGLQHALPYLTVGSEIVFQAKLHDETNGTIFPKLPSIQKVIIFGNSTILAGAVAKHFDELSKADGLSTYTYNSGFPGHSEFVPQLKALIDSGNVPNIVLLTKPWQPKKSWSAFHLPVSDLDLVNDIFPFRNLIRDAASFAFTARSRGGLRTFYQKAQQNIQQMRSDDGYYFISEQSHFPGERLPEGFHLPGDQPTVSQSVEADPASPELAELDKILRTHSIACFYVPWPSRGSGLGEAAPIDKAFQQMVESHTPCKVLGPDYWRYANQYLSDQTHLNHIGSRLYTEQLYELVKPSLIKDKR